MSEADLFESAGVVVEGDYWHWYLHARYMTREVTGWPKDKEITRRRVYHYYDSVVATTEDQAQNYFERIHGKPEKRHQWLHFYKGEKYKKRKQWKR